jgi:zinc protease
MAFAKTLSLALCVGLLSLPIWAQKKDNKSQLAPIPPPPVTAYSDVRRDTLLNGFQIVSLERADSTNVQCEIVLRAGSMFDLTDKTGLAMLTQAALMAVNPRVKEEFESLDAKIDWGVTHDTTWFRLDCPPANFDTAMEIFARLLVVENVRPDAVKKAQADQLAKIKAAQPTLDERATAAFFAALYGVHPYGHNLDGNEKTINGMRPGDLYDFVKRFYLSNNAFAVITGPVKHERLMRTFKTFMGGWTKGALTAPTFRPPLRVAALNLVKLEADAPNVELRGGVLGLRMGDPDFLTTQLLGHVLLIRLKGEAIGSLQAHTPARILPAPVAFAATLPADQAQAVSRKVTDAFAALATKEITADELASAQAALTEMYAARTPAQFLRDIETFTLAKNYPLNLKQAITNITAADAQRVAKRLLEANALTVVIAGRVNELKSQF